MCCSQSGCVEAGVARGHFGLAIILMHFGQVDAVLVQLGAGLLPPDGEVFAERAAQVGTVGSWLRHDLAERLAWALPVGTLYLNEHGECESSREA